MKNEYIRAGIIIVVALALGLVRNAISPNGISFTASGQQEIDQVSGESLPVEIELGTAHRLFQEGVTFIDARNAEDYQRSHIPEAISIPAVANFNQKLQATQDLDKNNRYILYCNNPECPLSHELYEFMQVAGFTNVHIMYEGYDGWTEAGYPVTGASQ